ncbi:MAG: hypothetical protein H6838_02875 [Planctomycetes bacterium]|nr:hypothetical protein [Planctomycetota bacterium]
MKPALLLLSLLAFSSLPTVALAQSPAKLKSELKTMEAAAKKDPDALFEAASWAAQKGLSSDAKRLYQQILKIKADHEGANRAVGNELFDGKWLPAKEAAAARKKAQAAEFSAKGFVEVSGVWVEKDDVADAKRGIFHHEGEIVGKDEKLALLAGKVRHPETGELIAAQDLERAKNRYFPIGKEGRWVDEQEANKYHSDVQRPWLVRSKNCTILSTLEIAQLEEVRRQADRGFECVMPLMSGAIPTPANRPVIIVAATESEYRDLGAGLGDGSDAAGAFLLREDAVMHVVNQGEVRAGICYYDGGAKGIGTFYVRHAAAMAYAQGLAVDMGVDLPTWFLHGAGAVASRFENDSDAGWFGKQLAQKGGVRNLKGFFSSFAISGDMEPTDISINIYEAGLMLVFAMRGGDEKATQALMDVTDILSGKKKGGIDKAIKQLETRLIEAEPAIGTFFNQLLAKAPK